MSTGKKIEGFPPLESVAFYRNKFNTKPIEFGDTSFKIGELAMNSKTVRFNDDGTQTVTYEFTYVGEAFKGVVIDSGLKEFDKSAKQ